MTEANVRRAKSILGYTAAGLTLLAMAAAPFLLMGLFVRGVAATGIRPDPVYAGGTPRATIARAGYRITVYHPVNPAAPLSRLPPYVQIAWGPARSLPATVSDEVDIDGDGRPDLRARFEVPRDESVPLRVEIDSLSGKVEPRRGVSRESLALLIARVKGSIVVRVPLR
jgi:hypothetical protein